MTQREIAVKQRYERYNKLAKIYQSLVELINETKKSGGMTAIDYESVRAAGGIKLSIEERVLNQIEKFESLRDETLTEFFEIGNEIADGLKLLTEDEQLVIIHRYLIGTPWKEIPEKVNYSERKVASLYAEALTKISAAQGGEDDKTKTNQN